MSRRIWLVGFLVLLFFGSPPLAQAGKGKLKFEIYQDKAKEYRWRLKAANGQVLATAGQGYKAKADCKKGVERLMGDLGKYKFEVYQDKAKEYRWRPPTGRSSPRRARATRPNPTARRRST
jgi:uncharacterized protein YegP (UPF0339 family)